MYSPFVDSKGNAVSIDKLSYRHLSQLVNHDEGYKIEYKSTFDKQVQKKLPDIITSFANCDGGWLFIGIDDESHQPIHIPCSRTDYSQIVSQLLKSRVTPLPVFYSKFIKNPVDKKAGVLAICIPEGNFPPYISNGKVYVRNGSSKEPVTSERSTMEFLYHKAALFENQLDLFCKRNIHFPSNKKTSDKWHLDYPICNVYLKYVGDAKKTLTIYAEREYLTNVVANFEDNLFQNVQYSAKSIVFKHRPIIPNSKMSTIVFEYFFDHSAKIHVPCGWTIEASAEDALDKLRGIGFLFEDNVKLFDGILAFNGIGSCMKIFFNTIKNFNLSFQDYALCFEIENGEDTVLFFDCIEYEDLVKSTGIPYHNWIENKSKPIVLKNYLNVTDDELFQTVLYDFLLASYGFNPATADKIVVAAHRKRYPELY